MFFLAKDGEERRRRTRGKGRGAGVLAGSQLDR